jgi:hypothetical protein
VARSPRDERRSKARRGVRAAPEQLTLADWEAVQAELQAPKPPPPPARANSSAEGSADVALLAEALAPRLADELSARMRTPSGPEAATARLLTLDELVAELPPGKRPQTWKRWLYERTRRGEVPGCVKLGGMLFFEREPALAWLRGGALISR